MKLFVLCVSAFSLIALAALADPVEEREAIMKERGKIVGGLGKIVQGEEPFEAAEVMAALTALEANAKKLDVDAHFPPGTGGGESEASPKIWEDMAGFKTIDAKYKADVEVAVAAAPADVDALKAHFGTITKNCGTCHETFRIKKD